MNRSTSLLDMTESEIERRRFREREKMKALSFGEREEWERVGVRKPQRILCDADIQMVILSRFFSEPIEQPNGLDLSLAPSRRKFYLLSATGNLALQKARSALSWEQDSYTKEVGEKPLVWRKWALYIDGTRREFVRYRLDTRRLPDSLLNLTLRYSKTQNLLSSCTADMGVAKCGPLLFVSQPKPKPKPNYPYLVNKKSCIFFSLVVKIFIIINFIIFINMLLIIFKIILIYHIYGHVIHYL